MPFSLFLGRKFGLHLGFYSAHTFNPACRSSNNHMAFAGDLCALGIPILPLLCYPTPVEEEPSLYCSISGKQEGKTKNSVLIC